jgi:hypothetical protein
MKQTLLTLLWSILKAAAVSGIFAGLAYLTGHSIILWFNVTFITQFVLFYMYGVYLDYSANKDLRTMRLKELEILSKITFNVPCAACKQYNEVVINANEDTNFVCTHCEVKNAVYVSVEAAVVTNPISTESTPI